MAAVRMKPTGPRIGGGAPVYTAEQFALVRPKGSYKNYLQFIKTRRGITQGSPYPGAGGPGLPTYMSLLNGLPPMETPAQLEARARRMADYDISGQKTLIQDEYKQANDDALRRMQAIAAAGRAAASLNAGLFGAVGGEYNRGAQEISGLATNLAGAAGTATAQDVSNINEALGRVGAPGVEATGALAGPGQVGVETYRGGTLPAQDLVAQGDSAQFGLAGMVAAQNLRATQEATAGLRDAGRTAEQTRAAAIKELAAGRPSAAAKYLQDLQNNQRQQVALAMSLIGARRGALQAGFNQKVTNRKLGQTDRQLTIAEKAADARVKAADAAVKAAAKKQEIEYGRIDSAASRATGFLIDRAGRPILDKSGKPIPVAKTAGTKQSGLTPYQATRAYEKASNLAETLFYGYRTVGDKRVPATQAPDFDPNNSATWGTGSAQYPQAMQRLLGTGISRAQARAILNQYYERGDSGRPIFTNDEARAIKARLTKDFGSKKEAERQWDATIRAIVDLLNANENDAADHRINEMLDFLK